METTAHATAPFIDGGLVFGPGGVLFYATYSNNTVGQVVPGGTGPARIIDLSPLGVASSTGSLLFVPQGFAGEGQLKILSYNASQWYSTTVSPDGNGTYDLAPVAPGIFLGGGPEGATIDPLTGDFLFCTFGGTGQMVRVTGFTKSVSCIGDINGDAQVNGLDLGVLLSVWGPCPG